MMWTFQHSRHNCFGFRAFQSFRQSCFSLFSLYSHFIVCFIFICLYYTDHFKIPSMNVSWEFYQNSRQTKKFKKTIKSFINFWKQSIFTTLFWSFLNYLNLLEGRDTFQMIQKHPTQCGNFLKIKEPSGKSENVQTFWIVSTQCKNFQDILGTSQTIGKYK